MCHDFRDAILEEIIESINLKRSILENEEILESINKAANSMINSLKEGGKILICGNGGSASDALHIAGELLGRFQRERHAYAALALNSDAAAMTAISNDYGYKYVFSRQVEGLMKPEDVLIGISTSGNSENIVRAFEQAKINGGKTVAITGGSGGKLKSVADIGIIVPGKVTAHIQEAHVCIYHILCDLVEQVLL